MSRKSRLRLLRGVVAREDYLREVFSGTSSCAEEPGNGVGRPPGTPQASRSRPENSCPEDASCSVCRLESALRQTGHIDAAELLAKLREHGWECEELEDLIDLGCLDIAGVPRANL